MFLHSFQFLKVPPFLPPTSPTPLTSSCYPLHLRRAPRHLVCFHHHQMMSFLSFQTQWFYNYGNSGVRFRGTLDQSEIWSPRTLYCASCSYTIFTGATCHRRSQTPTWNAGVISFCFTCNSCLFAPRPAPPPQAYLEPAELSEGISFTSLPADTHLISVKGIFRSLLPWADGAS